MKILAVDDDPVFLEVLLEILHQEGHQALTGQDGEQGWRLFDNGDFDLVLCDWVMPVLDGLELCRRIRRQTRPRYPYVILVTNQSGRTHYLEGMEAGADDFIEKPIDRELLVTRIRVARRILSLHSHVRRLEGMLSICCYCKRIKDDVGHWNRMEAYIAERSEASFSHCICEACYKEHVEPQFGPL